MTRTVEMPEMRESLQDSSGELRFLNLGKAEDRALIQHTESLRTEYYVRTFPFLRAMGYEPDIPSLKGIYVYPRGGFEVAERVSELSVDVRRQSAKYLRINGSKYREEYMKFRSTWEEMIDRGLWNQVNEVIGPLLPFTKRTLIPTAWGLEGSNWVFRDAKNILSKDLSDGVIFVNIRNRMSNIKRAYQLIHEFVCHALTAEYREHTTIAEANYKFHPDKEWLLDAVTRVLLLKLGYIRRIDELPIPGITLDARESTKNAFYIDDTPQNPQLKYPGNIKGSIQEIDENLRGQLPRGLTTVPSADIGMDKPQLLFLDYDQADATKRRLVMAEMARMYYYYTHNIGARFSVALIDLYPESHPSVLRGYSPVRAFDWKFTNHDELEEYHIAAKLLVDSRYIEYETASNAIKQVWDLLVKKGILNIAEEIIGPLNQINKVFVPTMWGTSTGSNWNKLTPGYVEFGLDKLFENGIIFLHTRIFGGKNFNLSSASEHIIHETVAHAFTENMRCQTVLGADAEPESTIPHHQQDKEFVMHVITEMILKKLDFIEHMRSFESVKPKLAQLVHPSTKVAVLLNPEANPDDWQLKYPGRLDLAVQEIHGNLKDVDPRNLDFIIKK